MVGWATLRYEWIQAVGSIMKVGDLVEWKKRYESEIHEFSGQIGLVVETSGGDVLVNWPDYDGNGRGIWYAHWRLRGISCK